MVYKPALLFPPEICTIGVIQLSGIGKQTVKVEIYLHQNSHTSS